MKKFPRPLLMAAWLCAAAAPAAAQSPPAASPPAWSLPLSRLIGHESVQRMEGAQGELRWSLPVPALWRPREVTLQLEGAASQALVPGSQWVLEVNGRAVQQVALGHGETSVRTTLPIAPGLLKPGYNELVLRYAQHYTDRCEYPMAGQLWSQVDALRSTLRIVADALPAPQTLDQLDALFDKASWEAQGRVPVWTVAVPDAALLQAMSQVAQGMGHRYDYLPVQLSAGRVPAPDAIGAALPANARAAVVLGSFAELASLMADLHVPRDQGPVVALRRVPGDDTRALLLVAAERHEQLPDAAAVLAMQRMPWPAQPWVAIRSLQMPPLGSVTGAAAKLRPSTQAFPFSAAGYRTTTYAGMNSPGASVRLWNPAWQGRVQVRLHAAYPAGLGPQSALNVLSNGVLHGSIPLDNPRGGSYDNYAVTVPAGTLKPGWNTLQFQPLLVPQSNGGECRPFFPGNLHVTVYDDSTVQTFGGSPLVRPDLALLARDGRPQPDTPVGLGMALQLTDADDATVGAGLTLLAKLTQVFNGPLLRTEFRVGPSAEARNRLWVGPIARLPAPVRAAAGLDDHGALDLPVPLISEATVPVLEGGDQVNALRDAVDPAAARPDTLAARVRTSAPTTSRAVAATALQDDKPLTVFTATDAATLEAAMATLVGYGPWSQLRGGLAVWAPGADKVQTVDADDAPFTAFSLRGGLGLWVSQYPWAALLLLLLLLGALVLLTRAMLARYRRKHLTPSRAA